MKDYLDIIHETEEKLKTAKNNHKLDKVVRYTRELEVLKAEYEEEMKQELFIDGNLAESVRHVVECMVYCNSAYKAAQSFENYLSENKMYGSVLLKRVEKMRREFKELTEYMMGNEGEPILDFNEINDVVEVKIQYYLQNVIANEVQRKVVDRINRERNNK